MNSSDEVEISDINKYLSVSVAMIVAEYFTFSCSSVSVISSLPAPEYWTGTKLVPVVSLVMLTE